MSITMSQQSNNLKISSSGPNNTWKIAGGGVSWGNNVTDQSNEIIFKDDNGNTVGVLKIEDGVMTFQGDVDKSAQRFFDALVEEKVKEYMNDKLNINQ